MMMADQELIQKKFGFLGQELLEEVMNHSQFVEIPADSEILREGQYIKVIPLVIEGAIKVFTRFKEKELLLYYIRPDESCIMSFAASMKNEPSKVFALTEVDTKALLLPISKIESWFKNYPQFNSLFFNLYNERYIDLLDTINHLLFNKLDQRVLTHLHEKEEFSGSKLIKTTHRQIAHELGTAREVISRIIKKLEKEGKLEQLADGIKLT
jgi:CRP/FNR family transcriptional regulator, anaerobic regulatory protein